MNEQISSPPSINAQIYLSNPPGSGPFPEFQLGQKSDRYLPTKRPVGVCISGGGIRSYSAAIGQLRGLTNITGNFLNIVGAISSVSGGTWFNTLFNYAPESLVDDATLLGPMVAPEKLTMKDIDILDQYFIGAPMPKADNDALGIAVVALETMIKANLMPQNRLWSRIINMLYASEFNLDNLFKSFSLDEGGVLNAYPQRTDRPYFIANATQVYPLCAQNVGRHFEYTPLYSGTSQLFKKAGPQGQDFGGGYIDSSAFDSKTPLTSGNPTRVVTPDPLFLLSDVMGSSSAAPERFLDKLDIKNVGFPIFNYWPPAHPKKQSSYAYSFADGGNLEDTGIVPLLRRQYPYIIAFVNAELPIGSNSDEAVDGISGQVSRLFGLNPQQTLGNNQDTQIFGRDKMEGKILFDRLAAGLKADQHTGASFIDTYTITPGNTFDIPPYPSTKNWPYHGNGKFRVLWFYLNLNNDWMTKIMHNRQAGIRHYLTKRTKDNNFENFPHYSTTGPNWDDVAGAHIPMPFQLSPQQIQLMANMTAYTVTSGKALQSLTQIQSDANAAVEC